VERRVGAGLKRGAAVDVMPSRADLRRFGMTIGAAVSVFPGLALPWLLQRTYPTWPWITGGLLVTAATVTPSALRVIYTPLTWLSQLLGRLTSLLLAAVVFFLFMTPVAWLMRVAQNDPMRRRLDRSVESYRVASRNSHPSEMERPF
jgi:hypothetical protein